MSDDISRRSFLTGLAAAAVAPAIGTYDGVRILAHPNSVLSHLKHMAYFREEVSRITGISSKHLLGFRK